jgi:hypothetical protein
MRHVTVISHEKVRKIAAQLGLSIKEKSGEYKIFGEGGIKKSIAVPNTKGGATRIYLVGFEVAEGFVAHPKPPAKTVTVMLDHAQPEKLCLRSLFKAAKLLAKADVVASPPASSPTVISPEVAAIDSAALAAS